MTNFLTIDGLYIAYTAAGLPSNPPLILVHGLMSHRGVWTRVMDELKDRFFCIAFDLPGFGESDKPQNGDYSIAKQAERVLRVADHFGFEQFTVIGHSMGGQIATYLTANLAPQRVHQLVSVDGVVTGELSKRTENLNRLLIVVGEKFPAIYTLFLKLFNSSTALAYWGFQPWFYKPEALPFDSWKLDRERALNPASATSVVKAWNSLNETNLTPCLMDIIAPTLIIFGNQDGTVPVDQAHIFKQQLGTAQLVLIDECGHFPMYEKFDECMAALDGFLNKP